jgi:tRNA (adenine22-N1)-methyltransferase
MNKISKRLNEILEWVNADVIADIGCDHAYVCVNAILEGKAIKAYACDVAQGPLNNAIKNIHENKLDTQIIPCLLDGIQGLSNEVEQIIISGMGGKLMIEILEKGNVLDNQKFILSPHKDSYALRKYLVENGFEIVREKMIYDENHFYPVLDCIKNNMVRDVNEAQLYFGVHALMNDTYLKYLDVEEKKYKSILSKVEKEDIVKKIEYIKEIRTQSIS